MKILSVFAVAEAVRNLGSRETVVAPVHDAHSEVFVEQKFWPFSKKEMKPRANGAPPAFAEENSCFWSKLAAGSMKDGDGCWLPYSKHSTEHKGILRTMVDPCVEFQETKSCDGPANFLAGDDAEKSHIWLTAKEGFKDLKTKDDKLMRDTDEHGSQQRNEQERTLKVHAQMTLEKEGEKFKGWFGIEHIRYAWCEAKKDASEHPSCTWMKSASCGKKPGDWYFKDNKSKPFGRCWSECTTFDNLAKYRLQETKDYNLPKTECADLSARGFKEGEQQFAAMFVTAEDEGKTGNEVMVSKEKCPNKGWKKLSFKSHRAKALCGLRSLTSDEQDLAGKNPGVDTNTSDTNTNSAEPADGNVAPDGTKGTKGPGGASPSGGAPATAGKGKSSSVSYATVVSVATLALFWA